MTWILSLLGVGGFGAALIFVPGLAARVLELIGIVLDWLVKHPSALVIAGLLLLIAHERQGWIKSDKVLRSTEIALKHEHEDRVADNLAWFNADKTNHQTIDTLIASLNDWSAFTRRWSATAASRQKAAQDALRTALARSAPVAGHVAAMRADAARAAPAGQECLSSQAVLDAKRDW